MTVQCYIKEVKICICCGSYGQLPTEKTEEKDLWIPKQNRKRTALVKL
jgi:hypothetical protein